MSNTNIATSIRSRLFECSSCSKSFTRKDYLYRHEKNHAQFKPFKCDQCNLSFTRSDLLTKHFKSKSHQRIRNKLTDSGDAGNTGGGGSLVGSNYKSNPKQVPYKVEKKTFDLPVNFPMSSIMNDTLLSSQSSRLNELNKELEMKKFKRIRRSCFSNRHFEKIPAPPPQPSIILPAILKNGNNSSSINSANLFMNQSQEKGKEAESNIYTSSNQQQHPNGHRLDSQDQSNPTLSTFLHDRSDVSGGDQEIGSDAPPGCVVNNLLWLFNDTPPVDNLAWLFSDISQGKNGCTGGEIDYKLVNSNNLKLTTNPIAATDMNTNPSNSTYGNVDMTSIMYQNLYNESTNTNINNNKINMNESTRSRIIHIFPSVDQLNKTSLERFEEYLDLYWFSFAQTFPLIHQATFNPNTMNIYLLISMIVIGMAHSLDKLEYETSIALNKKFRGLIYDVIEDSTELPLPLMQALILHNFSAKNFGDTQLSKIAQIDHGSNIMYLKFSGFLNNLAEPIVTNASLTELTEQWQNWIYYESCKRTVFFEFICDTQHVTFSKVRSLSAFDIKLELPCTDEVWNCADPVRFFEEYQKQPKGSGVGPRLDISGKYAYAKEFEYLYNNEKNNENKHRKVYGYGNDGDDGDVNTNANFERVSEFSKNEEYLTDFFNIKTPKDTADSPKASNTLTLQQSIKSMSKWPTFLWTLKSMMTTYKSNQKEYPLDCYSLFSRYIILHGLLRICWDMRGQSLLDLGFVSKRKLSESFKKLENAFLNWKGYFDLHVKLYEKQVESNESRNGKDFPNKHLILSLNNYGPTNASWANISFYYTGLFCLYADIPSVTIFTAEYNKFNSVTKTAYKGIKEMEYERNKLIVEQWARSMYGKLALIEACKFLRLVYGNEETINTFSHIPQTVYLAALIVWCYEIKRDCPNVEMMKTGRKLEVEHCKIKLNASKYFDILGNIHYGLSKGDAWEYFSMILDLENNLNDNYADEQNNDQGFVGKDAYEQFKERQMNTIGVVCYVLHLLRNCKWVYSIDLVQQLEHVILTYEKL